MSFLTALARADVRRAARLRGTPLAPPRMVDALSKGDVTGEIAQGMSELQPPETPASAYIARMNAALPDGPIEEMAETDR